jgi:hypothetical protein
MARIHPRVPCNRTCHVLVQHFSDHFQDAFVLLFFHHYNLLASAPWLTLVLAHVTLHKSALLAAVLMTALVHCSHILRHVLLQKSAALAAVPLRCSCDRLWSPSFFFFYKQNSRNVLTCASASTNIDNDNPRTGHEAAPAIRSVVGLQAHTQLSFCGIYALTQRGNSLWTPQL